MPARSTTLVRSRPRQPRPPALQSVQGDYGSALWNIVTGQAQPSRLPVTERTVAGLVGSWAAARKISNAVAQMMVEAQAYGPDARTPITAPSVLVDPCSGYDSFTYWSEAATTALLRGNFVAIKADADPLTGYPRQVVPVPIDSVNAHYDADGFPVYEIGGELFRPDEIVHVRVGLTMPGQIMGIGVVEAHRRGLQGMLDQQGMTNDVWTQGAVPSGVVQIDADMPTREQVAAVKSGWIGNLGGQRTVAVTGKRMSYTPVTWSAEDAQWLESRQFSIAECALMFGLRPEDLGSSFGASSGAMSYGNRTDDALQRIIDSYTPVMLPFEQAWSRLISGRNFVRGNVEALMRSTPMERLQYHALAQSIGLETVDETREAEGKPELPKADVVADATTSTETPTDG